MEKSTKLQAIKVSGAIQPIDIFQNHSNHKLLKKKERKITGIVFKIFT